MRVASQFKQAIRSTICAERPRRIIETGTFLGTGSTAAICDALLDAALWDTEFQTIEVNPVYFTRAVDNCYKYTCQLRNFTMRNGMSLPKGWLMSPEKIQDWTIQSAPREDVFVDHDADRRVELYYAETNFPDAEHDLLGQAIRESSPDMLMLDSAGHLGFEEFRYALGLLKKPCIICLDDTKHVKHYCSALMAMADARFTLMFTSDEKFGSAIFRFTP